MKKEDKNLTIYDIASLAKVSKTTVSRYINGKYEYMSLETKERIASIIEKHSFSPSNAARSLTTKSTKLIAFIVSDIENPFAAPTIQAMNQSLLGTNYHLVVSSSNNLIEQEQLLFKSVLEQRVDAILLNAVSFDSSYINDLNINVPLILVDRKIKNYNTDYVGTDSIKSMKDSFVHLKEEGFSEIHIFTEEYLNVETRLKRVEGYKTMMLMEGYTNKELEEKYVHVISKKDNKKILDIVTSIINNTATGVPAIICTNGSVSLLVALAIKKLKLKMPNDIGLIAFDDFGSNNSFGWTELYEPSITRLAPDWHEIGIRAIEVLNDKLESNNVDVKDITIDVKLYKEGSTKLKKII